MTTLMYLSREMKIGTLQEIQEAAKQDPTFMATMKQWAREEMANKGIEITPDKVDPSKQVQAAA